MLYISTVFYSNLNCFDYIKKLTFQNEFQNFFHNASSFIGNHIANIYKKCNFQTKIFTNLNNNKKTILQNTGILGGGYMLFNIISNNCLLNKTIKNKNNIDIKKIASYNPQLIFKKDHKKTILAAQFIYNLYSNKNHEPGKIIQEDDEPYKNAKLLLGSDNNITIDGKKILLNNFLDKCVIKNITITINELATIINNENNIKFNFKEQINNFQFNEYEIMDEKFDYYYFFLITRYNIQQSLNNLFLYQEKITDNEIKKSIKKQFVEFCDIIFNNVYYKKKIDMIENRYGIKQHECVIIKNQSKEDTAKILSLQNELENLKKKTNNKINELEENSKNFENILLENNYTIVKLTQDIEKLSKSQEKLRIDMLQIDLEKKQQEVKDCQDKMYLLQLESKVHYRDLEIKKNSFQKENNVLKDIKVKQEKTFKILKKKLKTKRNRKKK
jgi:hypothetical protein